MGLEELERDIVADYEARIGKLREETKSKCNEIVSSAGSDATKALKDAKSEAAEGMKSLEKRELAAARLEEKKTMNEAREKVVERILEDVRQGLVQYAGSPEYKKLLPKLVEKAASEIKGDVVVKVRKTDRQLVKKHSLSKEDLDCIGGPIVGSRDSNVKVDATLDSLLEQSRPKLRETVYRRLFA